MLRNTIEKALLTSLSDPLDLLNNDFKDYIQSLNKHIYAQTCYMQAMLNNNFDYFKRRISVRTATIDFNYFLLWKENQNKPVIISKGETEGLTSYLLNRDGQIGRNNADFEVVFPEFFVLSLSELKQLRILLNQNKIASKKYSIVYE
jgi:hypothetical protein